MKPRTRARSLALQVLYEVDIANHPPADTFRSRLEETPLSDELSNFARQIIFGVLPLTNNLDQLIAKYAPEWPFEQVATIDRNILRIALWDLALIPRLVLSTACSARSRIISMKSSRQSQRHSIAIWKSSA